MTTNPHEFDEDAYRTANPDVDAAVRSGLIASAWEHFCSFGLREGRSGRLPRKLSRVEKAMYGLKQDGLGLEIGPSHNPIAPKKNGYQVHILDHASAEELRAKYAKHAAFGVNVDNIEEVDFVWGGQPLPELIGKTAYYDWIIASHVIEHVPDFVSFLQQCEALLKPAGKLSLIIPDRRYCFDFFNRETATGDVLDAFIEKRTRPTPGKVFDHFANATKRDGTIAWSPEANGPLEFVHSFAQAKAMWEQAQHATEYIDVHCWRFTPISFQLLIADLQNLGLVGLGATNTFDTCGCEFYVTMGKGAAVAPVDRAQCLSEMRNAG